MGKEISVTDARQTALVKLGPSGSLGSPADSLTGVKCCATETWYGRSASSGQPTLSLPLSGIVRQHGKLNKRNLGL